MFLKSRKMMLALMAGCLLIATGCSPGLSALAKFQSGDIGSLSADDWQSLAELGGSVGVPVPQVTTQQATAIVKFLSDNKVETIQDLQTLLHSGNVTVPSELMNLLG